MIENYYVRHLLFAEDNFPLGTILEFRSVVRL